MKKAVTIFLFIVAIECFAQNPVCVSVTDVPCDGSWSQDSFTNSTGNEVDGLWLFYDAGSEDNGVSWEIYDETQLYASGFNCGCGTLDFPGFFLDAAHEITLKIKVTACDNQCDAVLTAKAKLYSPKSGNQCADECD